MSTTLSAAAKQRDDKRVEAMLAARATSDDQRGGLWRWLDDEREADPEWEAR
jgi:hypothetical protein